MKTQTMTKTQIPTTQTSCTAGYYYCILPLCYRLLKSKIILHMLQLTTLPFKSFLNNLQAMKTKKEVIESRILLLLFGFKKKSAFVMFYLYRVYRHKEIMRSIKIYEILDMS